MGNWFDRIDKGLVVIFILLYVGAKLHFFTRYWKLGFGGYLEEHVWFWAGTLSVALSAGLLNWLRKGPPNSN